MALTHMRSGLIGLALAGALAACGPAPVASVPTAAPADASTSIPTAGATVAPAPTSAGDAGGEENAVTTASGLTYIEIAPGAGDAPKTGDVVSVHYRGTLADGKVFDSSYERGQPIQFALGRGMVIPGWDEGIGLMRKGGKAKLIIPPNLGYGAQGAGGVIPPNATLTFEVELVDIQAGPPEAPAQVDDSQYTTTPSGLKYYDFEVGSGAEATAGKTAVVHYTGWLTDGTMFDSSLNRGDTFPFQVGAGRVIKGWDEGVAGMRVGGRRQLVVPSSLGYGANGAGGVIPPNATLIFEVELVDVQ